MDYGKQPCHHNPYRQTLPSDGHGNEHSRSSADGPRDHRYYRIPAFRPVHKARHSGLSSLCVTCLYGDRDNPSLSAAIQQPCLPEQPEFRPTDGKRVDTISISNKFLSLIPDVFFQPDQCLHSLNFCNVIMQLT